MAEPRHKKMYANSPKLGRDEDGRVAITRAEKKSAEVASGTDGMPMHDTHVAELAQKHTKEVLDLYQKHTKDYLEIAQKAAGAASTDTSKKGD